MLDLLSIHPVESPGSLDAAEIPSNGYTYLLDNNFNLEKTRLTSCSSDPPATDPPATDAPATTDAPTPSSPTASKFQLKFFRYLLKISTSWRSFRSI